MEFAVAAAIQCNFLSKEAAKVRFYNFDEMRSNEVGNAGYRMDYKVRENLFAMVKVTVQESITQVS